MIFPTASNPTATTSSAHCQRVISGANIMVYVASTVSERRRKQASKTDARYGMELFVVAAKG
jgi:hypothetical protein